jgi:pyridoxal phosphate enzyme (YggS family)
MTVSNADDTGATAAVAERVAMARFRIAAAAPDPSRVRLVAVTKGFGPDAVRAALAAGVTDIGENYADELVGKAEALATSGDSGAEPASRWHFLGAVQRNKVARLAPLVDCWQSVARIEEGRAIARRHPGATVLVQVDVAGGHGRNGCPPEGVAELVTALAAEELDVAGLMTIGPPGPAEASRPAFALVRELASGLGLAECSMGMTDDMDVALAEGSTMIRLGRALFGERPPRPRP